MTEACAPRSTRMPGLALQVLTAAFVTSFSQAVAAEAATENAWNADRARLFSQVCLKAAPTFAQFEALARKSGFVGEDDRLHFAPEVYVSLLAKDRACTCYMTMGAPDQTDMVVAIFNRMVADFSGSWRPNEKGIVNDVTFVLEGQKVHVLLTGANIDGVPWVKATATAAGRCPA
jgi:hypothetical protein